jgi:hypothetical protein
MNRKKTLFPDFATLVALIYRWTFTLLTLLKYSKIQQFNSFIIYQFVSF